jgi:5-methylcytosine-specific restriction protein A
VARLAHCGGCMRTYPIGELKRGRCPACAKAMQRAKDARRGTTTARGYGSEWRKLRAQVIAASPACAICGHTGSKDNPLSVDHILPRSQGGTDALSNLRVLCLRHNQLRPRGRATHDPTPNYSRNALSHDAHHQSREHRRRLHHCLLSACGEEVGPRRGYGRRRRERAG